jgi:hypothetical protein
LCHCAKQEKTIFFFLEAKMKKKHQVVVVPDDVREEAEVGRWRLQLAADGIAMVLRDGFSVAFLV